MLVSVYTPTHDPKYLLEAYESLKDQTHQDWQWVLVPNGPRWAVPKAVRDDPRVLLAPLEDTRIGALKAHAVTHCKGELLVELDHDDMLEANCLARLLEALDGEGADSAFLFSDSLNFWDDGRSETFSAEFGWEDYDVQWRGRMWKALRAFAPSARSLAEIEFAPNHVRAWTRAAYEKAGGYNREMACADDHDLMCRTYLAGVPFVHVPEPLYYYRRHQANSFERPLINEAIHRQSIQVMNAYLHALVAEWCRREGLAMYDLGGAHRCPEGFVPIDRELPDGMPGLRMDVLSHDFKEWLARNEGRAGCVRAVDFFEHIPSTRVPGLMNDLHALLAHEGWLLTETPAVSDDEGRVGWGAFRDPTHVSFWTPDNWRYYTEAGLARFVPEVRCKFQEVRIWVDYPSEGHFREKCPYLYADLCAGKPGRRLPGGLRI